MASTGTKVATGCGIGCLLLVLIVGGVGTCGYFGVRSAIDNAEDMGDTFEVMAERWGDIEDHVPNIDGTISADRMSVFISVREDLVLRSTETIEIVSTLDGDANFIAKTRAGLRLIPALLNFLALRNTILLEQDMSPGEYVYIYNAAYYGLIGIDPGDGPGFQLNGNGHGHGGDNDGFNWQTDVGNRDDGWENEDRERQVGESLNKMIRPMLKNMKRTLADDSTVDPSWLSALDDEIDALAHDYSRRPWEDGLPTPLAASIEPFWGQLEAAYEPYLNALEMATIDESD